MLALGEDPDAFDRLCQRLWGSFPGADAFFEQQVLDLTHLYWRRGRAERALDALTLHDLEIIDHRHHQRGRLRQRRRAPAGEEDRRECGVNGLLPCPAKFRELQEALGELRRHLAAGEFGGPSLDLTRRIYGVGGAPDSDNRLRELLREGREKLKQDETVEEEQREALELIDDEIDRVTGEQETWESDNTEGSAAQHEYALIPEGEKWRQTLQMLEHLDRAIDRKTRIIMDLAKSTA
ncbi:MAG: hypothetical protein ACRD1L_13930, partial [Terriglobales bacterium]